MSVIQPPQKEEDANGRPALKLVKADPETVARRTAELRQARIDDVQAAAGMTRLWSSDTGLHA